MGISRDAEIIHKYISMGYSQQEIAETLGISSWDVNKAIKGNNFNKKYQGSYKSGQSRGAFPDATEEDIQDYLDNYADEGITFEDFFYGNEEEEEEEDYDDNDYIDNNNHHYISNNSSKEPNIRFNDDYSFNEGSTYYNSRGTNIAAIILIILLIVIGVIFYFSKGNSFNLIELILTAVLGLAVGLITIRAIIAVFQAILGYRDLNFLRVIAGGFLVYLGTTSNDFWGVIFTILGAVILYSET